MAFASLPDAEANAGCSDTRKARKKNGSGGAGGLFVFMALAGLLTSMPIHGAPIYYNFEFQTQALGHPLPSGGFYYDSSTATFADFVVMQDGIAFDFTAAANAVPSAGRIPFEMGRLGQNLIDGFGPMGPEFSHWYAGPDGFYGFEWRTPAEDFLSWDLTPGGGDWFGISALPRAVAGSWSTTVGAPAPEPASVGMMAVAIAAGAVVWRRRRLRAGRPGVNR